MFLDPGELERKALTTEGRWLGWCSHPPCDLLLSPLWAKRVEPKIYKQPLRYPLTYYRSHYRIIGSITDGRLFRDQPAQWEYWSSSQDHHVSWH